MNKETQWEQSITRVGVVAGSVIAMEGKYLLVQEKQPKVYGLWNLPAGYVDKGESIEAAAIRETKEETGFDIEIVQEIAVYHETVSAPVKHAFVARVIGGNLSKQPSEILDVKWLSYEEIKSLNNNDKIRAPWVWDAINVVQKGSKT